MKKFIVLIIVIVASASVAYSAEIKGSISTGAYIGTPFWSDDNLSGDTRVDSSMRFMRMFNRLNLDGKFDDFSIHLTGSRSDGFELETQGLDHRKFQLYGFDTKYHLTDTRIQRAYVQYKFDGGNVKAGRLSTFNRWYFGSVDGGALSYKLADDLTFSGFGGVDVKYGTLYSDNNRRGVGFGELAYRFGKYGANLKAMYSEDAFKSGFDFHGVYSGVRFSANFGYDFTNSKLFDGSLALFGYAGKDFTWSGNITRFTPYSWSYNFSTYIDRIQAGVSYRIADGFFANFKQMFSKSENYSNYLSSLSFNWKYLCLGLNYMGGDTETKKFGVSLGGNYSFGKAFRVSAGISSVDYLFSNDYQEIEQSALATYLKMDWNIIGGLWLGANLNHYDNNRILNEKYRGGVSLQYQFCMGGN